MSRAVQYCPRNAATETMKSANDPSWNRVVVSLLARLLLCLLQLIEPFRQICRKLSESFIVFTKQKEISCNTYILTPSFSSYLSTTVCLFIRNRQFLRFSSAIYIDSSWHFLNMVYSSCPKYVGQLIPSCAGRANEGNDFFSGDLGSIPIMSTSTTVDGQYIANKTPWRIVKKHRQNSSITVQCFPNYTL